MTHKPKMVLMVLFSVLLCCSFLSIKPAHALGPINKSMVLINASIGLKGCYPKHVDGRGQGYLFRATVEMQPYNFMGSITMILDYGGSALRYKWVRATDTFTEEYDPNGYASIYSTPINSWGSWIVDFEITFSYSYPDENIHSVRVESVDDTGLHTDADTYFEIYYVDVPPAITVPTTCYFGFCTGSYFHFQSQQTFDSIYRDASSYWHFNNKWALNLRNGNITFEKFFTDDILRFTVSGTGDAILSVYGDLPIRIASFITCTVGAAQQRWESSNSTLAFTIPNGNTVEIHWVGAVWAPPTIPIPAEPTPVIPIAPTDIIPALPKFPYADTIYLGIAVFGSILAFSYGYRKVQQRNSLRNVLKPAKFSTKDLLAKPKPVKVTWKPYKSPRVHLETRKVKRPKLKKHRIYD